MVGYYKRMFLFHNLGMLILLVGFESSLVICDRMDHTHSLFTTVSMIFVVVGCFIYLRRLLYYDGLEKIDEYCKKSRVKREQLESDFKTSKRFGRNIRKGEQWIYYRNSDLWPDIIKISDINDIEFVIIRRSRSIEKYMYAHDRTNEITKIPMNKRTFRKLQKEQIC